MTSGTVGDMTTPAIRIKKLGPTTWSVTLPILKSDDETRMHFGCASVITDAEGRLHIDSDDDVIRPEQLEKAVYGYVAEYGGADVMHERPIAGALVESCFMNPEKREAMSVSEGPVLWWWGYRVDDLGVHKRISDGELKELSIYGEAVRTPWPGLDGVFELTELQIERVGFVDKGAGVSTNVCLSKRAQPPAEVPKMSELLKKILAKIAKEEDRAAITKAIGKAEVTTLTDVQEALTPELWAVVLAALEAAATVQTPDPPAPAPEPKAEDNPDDDPDPTVKTDDDKDEATKALKKQLDESNKTQAKLSKQIENMEKRERIGKYNLEAAKYPCAFGTPEEIGKRLMAADDMPDKEMGKSFRESVEREHETRKKSDLLNLYGDGGRGGDGPADESPMGKIRATRDRLMKEDPKLTASVAFGKACKLEPDAYLEHYSERRRQGGSKD